MNAMVQAGILIGPQRQRLPTGGPSWFPAWGDAVARRPSTWEPPRPVSPPTVTKQPGPGVPVDHHQGCHGSV